MLAGDPDKFAIWFDVVEAWNRDESFANGLLFVWISGEAYPKTMVTATLRREIPLLAQKLQTLSDDDDLYDLSAEETFVAIYHRTFPSDRDVDNDYRFDLTPDALADNDHFVFAIKSDENVRILASQLRYLPDEGRHDLCDLVVSEAILTMDDVDEILRALVIR